MRYRLQHPHSNQAQPESISQVFELRPREGFGHNVGDVVGAGNVGERNFVVVDGASNKKVTECDVLRSLVKFVVLRESNRRLVIAVERDGRDKFGMDFL